MPHDHFTDERLRVEQVLDILEHAANRLEDGADVPLSLLHDAVEFVRATEEAAYDAALNSDDAPPLPACIEQHVAARAPLQRMHEAVAALERGAPSAAASLVQHAREYVRLRREHLRLDDRLFAATRHALDADRQGESGESVESPATRQIYERLVDGSAILNTSAPTAVPAARRHRVHRRIPM
jgi:hemerythrin-like domain-containing protein